jgi:hypothetical protein
MEPFLTVIIEHIFVVQDGNIEVLQSSADGVSDGLGIVGLNDFELLHEFFELLDRSGLVAGRDSELFDVSFFVLGKYRRVGMRGSEPEVPVFVESCIVSSSRCLADFSG